MIKTVISVVMMLALVIPTNSIDTSDIVHANIRLADPDLLSEPDAEASKVLSFHIINGIDVNWNKDQLIKEAGYPYNSRKDEILGTVELLYPTITVGIYNGQIDYLIVPANQSAITIDGAAIPLTAASLRHKLGQPDYVAEDGIVYEREGLCLKLFYKSGSTQKKLDSVQVFWSAEV